MIAQKYQKNKKKLHIVILLAPNGCPDNNFFILVHRQRLPCAPHPTKAMREAVPASLFDLGIKTQMIRLKTTFTFQVFCIKNLPLVLPLFQS